MARRATKQAEAVTIRVSRSARKPLASGHPWLFREGPNPAPIGTVAALVDDRDKALAWGLVDEGPIAVRVLGRGRPPELDLAALWIDRVRRADGVRLRLLPQHTDAYRVVSGAGDGLPGVVVDRYGGLAVLRLYGKAWESHLDGLVRAVRSLHWVTGVLRRLGVERVDGRQGAELLWGERPGDTLVVQEHGMRLLVRPWVGQKTGLFLDQREHRHMVRGWASGRMVANLFAYNGGFSVAAALGGAARVITVDIAPDAIEDAKEVFRLNGLDPDEHGFEVADVFAWSPRSVVDLLIVDPPSLTHGRKSDGAARSAYRKLHARLGPFVPRDGLLATSSCSARLDMAGWRQSVSEGLSGTGDWSWHWVSGEPPDHPAALVHREARYLKFALLRRR